MDREQIRRHSNENKEHRGTASERTKIWNLAGLEPVVNSWPFAILENGNPNQTKSWVLQNEENVGNVTIKLWRKGGKSDQWNWEGPVTIANLKPGKDN